MPAVCKPKRRLLFDDESATVAAASPGEIGLRTLDRMNST